jgi:hypothetical protein
MMLSDSNLLFTLHTVQVTSVQSEWEYPTEPGAVTLSENNKRY